MITKRIRNTKIHRTLTAAVALFFVLALTIAILEVTGITHIFNPTAVKTANQKLEDASNSSNKKNFINNNSTSNNSSAYNNPTSNDISLSTEQEANGSITILTHLTNYSDGTCSLTIHNGSITYTQTAPVIFQSSFSSCAGFNVTNSELPNGTWQISLTVSSKGKTNTITSTMEVK